MKLLQENLRLEHVKEGENQIRNLCIEFLDIFRLPGDKLTSTKSAVHYNPTPSIPKGRTVTLNNHRLPLSQQEEIDEQAKHMLEQVIITLSNSEWNFPIIVVPKKIDVSGKQK